MSDAWTLPSGQYGPERPYTFEIIDAKWILDPTDQNNPDVPRIALVGRTDDPDWEEWTLPLRVERKGWNIVEDGRLIRHDNPRKDRPSANTQFGRFVVSIGDNQAPDNNLDQLITILQKRGKPVEANVWTGLKIVVGEEPGSFVNDEGERQKFYSAVVTDFEGEIDDATMSSYGEQREAELNELKGKLAEVAKSEDSHGNFVNKVLSEMNINDPELLSDVMDSSNEGFYARANN